MLLSRGLSGVPGTGQTLHLSPGPRAPAGVCMDHAGIWVGTVVLPHCPQWQCGTYRLLSDICGAQVGVQVAHVGSVPSAASLLCRPTQIRSHGCLQV